MIDSCLLEVDRLEVSFGSHHVLKNASFQIQRNEAVAIIGKSGSGKTVLLRTLAGLLKPSHGKLNYNFKSNHAIPIGFAFQKSPLFPWLSVLENLQICTRGKLELKQCEDFLEQVGLLEFASHTPQNISGGMAQKLNLLRAIANGCELILMDEPFGALDGFQRSELQQFTHELHKKKGQAILLITHDIDEAILVADRILILSSKSGTLSHEIKVDLKKSDSLLKTRQEERYPEIYELVYRALSEDEFCA